MPVTRKAPRRPYRHSDIALMAVLLCLPPGHPAASETPDEPVELAAVVGLDVIAPNVAGLADGSHASAGGEQLPVATPAVGSLAPPPIPATAISLIDWLLLAIAPILLWLLHWRWPSAGGTSRGRP